MYLKALTIDPADVVCRTQPSALAVARAGQAADDALMDLAVELLVRRGGLSERDLGELSARVRKTQALNRWRDRPL